MRSVVPVLVVVKVAGPGPCTELRDGFLDLKTDLKIRFISFMINVERERTFDYISGVATMVTTMAMIRHDRKSRHLSYN